MLVKEGIKRKKFRDFDSFIEKEMELLEEYEDYSSAND